MVSQSSSQKINQKIEKKSIILSTLVLLLAHMAFKKSPKIPLHSATNYQVPHMNFMKNIVASGSYDFQRTVVHIKDSNYAHFCNKTELLNIYTRRFMKR